jgi:uncharacterized protein YkvS
MVIINIKNEYININLHVGNIILHRQGLGNKLYKYNEYDIFEKAIKDEFTDKQLVYIREFLIVNDKSLSDLINKVMPKKTKTINDPEQLSLF